MPNIIEQTVSKDGIYIKATNGNVFQVTREEIKAHYATETGNAATRKANTIAWLKNQIVLALGSDMVSTVNINTNFDTTDDTQPLLLEVSR